MLVRILGEALRRRKRRTAVAMLAIGVGAALAATLFTLSADVSDKVGRELRAYGANILVSPRSADSDLLVEGTASGDLAAGQAGLATLDERELVKLKTIFWRNNVVGFAPYLSLMVSAGSEQVVLTGTWFEKELTLPKGTRVRSTFAGQSATATEDRFRTGVKAIAPWWKVTGEWVEDGDQAGALVGATLAERLGLRSGDELAITHGGHVRHLRVAGIVSTGGLEEQQVFVNLPVAQELLGLEQGASQVLVSALVTPKEKLAPSLRGKKPEEMTPKEYETWYCTPLLESIALQIEEVIPSSQARAIRQVSEAEGSFATRIELLLALVTAVALGVSALGVMTTMTATVLERRGEIGLMKAVGADDLQVASIFLAEAALVGLLGGSLGYLAGIQLARVVGELVFGTAVAANLVALPLTLALAVAVGLLGAALPVRGAVRIQPVTLLRGS